MPAPILHEDLIAPCGMNCALCIAYQARKHDLNRHHFHRSYCPGCLPRGEHCRHMKKSCDRLGNGLVRFCFDCEDFPCRRLKALSKRYETKYHMSMLDNLFMIREQGLQAFIDQQEAQWRCKACADHLLCCHNGLCLHCDLDVLKQNRKYRWGEQDD